MRLIFCLLAALTAAASGAGAQEAFDSRGRVTVVADVLGVGGPVISGLGVRVGVADGVVVGASVTLDDLGVAIPQPEFLVGSRVSRDAVSVDVEASSYAQFISWAAVGFGARLSAGRQSGNGGYLSTAFSGCTASAGCQTSDLSISLDESARVVSGLGVISSELRLIGGVWVGSQMGWGVGRVAVRREETRRFGSGTEQLAVFETSGWQTVSDMRLRVLVRL